MSKPCSGRASPDLAGGELSTSHPTAPLISISPPVEQKPEAHSPHTSTRATRSTSPNRLPAELVMKFHSQVNRLDCLMAIQEDLKESPPGTLKDIEAELEELNQLHTQFGETHAHFELNWPASFLDHPYFNSKMQAEEGKLYRKVKLALIKARNALQAGTEHSTQSSSQPRTSSSKLPDIQLRSFSGAYWHGFKEMFESLILKNKDISNIERLHYLRSCMQGAPAQLIANLPLAGSSLAPSWELLNARYDNKRLLIQAQLDKLCETSTISSRTSAGLYKLILNALEALKALASLEVKHSLQDLVAVHLTSRQLDRPAREMWKTSLGASTEYPSFQQFEKFLNSRAGALERIETTSAQPLAARLQQPKKTAVVHQAPTQPEDTHLDARNYHCDCCHLKHYIVACLQFRAFNVTTRRRIATEARLCYNCLGRHNVGACRSSLHCKQCSSFLQHRKIIG